MWLHSSVGKASHRYRGGHGFESRWSPDFFQASSFQLLKLENLLRWSFFTSTRFSWLVPDRYGVNKVFCFLQGQGQKGEQKDIIILLPYLGLQSNQVAKRLKSCVYKFYSCVNLKIVFQSTRCIKSFFPYKDRINRSQQSRVIYRANCWDCNGFYIGKTKRRLHDRKTEHFKALAKNDNTSAIADHVKATGHNIKWDHFDILAKGKTDYHCKIKETLYIQELEPAFNVNVGSEKLMLY